MLIKIKDKEDNMPLVKTEAFRGMWDEYERMGFVESPEPIGSSNHMHNGWMCSFLEFGGKWTPLAYKRIGEKEFNINNLGQFSTREQAGKALYGKLGSG